MRLPFEQCYRKKRQPRRFAGAVGPRLLTSGELLKEYHEPKTGSQLPLQIVPMERLIAYIDGFNLYYGLRDARLNSSRWLDLRGMCESLLKPGQRLELVRYFTSRVRGDVQATDRQALFIDALHARGGIEMDFGHFLT